MIVAALLLALCQGGSPIVRFDSREQGRTFSVDPDKPEIRQALRDVSAPSPAGTIPDWLPPFPGAQERPHRARTTLWTSASRSTPRRPLPTLYSRNYQAAIQAAKPTITYINQRPGRGGAIHVDDGTRTAVVSVSPGVGPTDISVNWRPKIIRCRARAVGTGRFSAVDRVLPERQDRDRERAPDRMHQIYLDILKRSKDTGIRLMDHTRSRDLRVVATRCLRTQSARSAWTGSILAARCAGRNAAIPAAASNIVDVAASDIGSIQLTP
jgi:hypothetical protein